LLLQAYLGPPSAAARYEILRSGLLELARAGLISGELGFSHLDGLVTYQIRRSTKLMLCC
jgi:hypothetical protein